MRTEKRDCSCPNVRHEHGTWHAYATDDCGCPPCREAWRRYYAQLRKRRYLSGGSMFTHPCGTARRLQALAVNGWGAVDVARELGCTKFVVEQWRAEASPRVTHRTAARIAALYERIWDQPTPSRYGRKVRNIAAAAGWAPPLAWDDIDDPDETPNFDGDGEGEGGIDEVIVDRIMSGHAPGVGGPEREEAIRRLAAYGMTDSDIGRRIGMGSNNVQQFRGRHGIPSRVSGGGGVAA